MHLGSRKIRSAGRTSGSIEITLPVRLQSLEGISCTIEVRDGLRPEIVLQPNVSDAQEFMRLLWGKLSIGFSETGDIGEFRLGDFTISIFPTQYWTDRPPLCYADALHTLETWHEQREYRHEELGRLFACLAVQAGKTLGLGGEVSLAFGGALAYLITRRPVGLGTDFERGMAYRLLGEEARNVAYRGDLLDDATWKLLASGVRDVFDQFFLWQETLELYEEDRNNWYRALALEMESVSSDVSKTS